MKKGAVVLLKGTFVLGGAFIAPVAIVFKMAAHNSHAMPDACDIIAASLAGACAAFAAGVGFMDNSFHELNTPPTVIVHTNPPAPAPVPAPQPVVAGAPEPGKIIQLPQIQLVPQPTQ